MRRMAMVGVAGVLLGAWCLRAPEPVRAAGELQGRELAPARDLETGLESLLGHLLGGGQPSSAGRIESAVVTEDSDSRLTVAVTCSAGLEGRRLRGELIGRDRRTQRQFRTEPVRVEDGAREVQISFAPASGVAGGELADSAFLRVSVDGGGPELKRVFVLNKSWQGGGASGSGPIASVVRIKPRPEPLASALPPTEPPEGPVVQPSPGGVRPGGVLHQPGVVVRDHRGESRDRRTEAPVVVRDHRPEKPKVRNHRTAPAPAPTSARQREAVLLRTAPAVGALRPDSRVLKLDTNVLHISPADQGQGAKGPNPMDTHDLLEELSADPIGLEMGQVASIKPLVFRDQNPSSPFFYFLPETYHLGWRADQRRYDMAMLYLAATTPGSAGEVSMAAGLTAGIDQDEINMVEKLLRAYCRYHPCPATPQLRPFPIDPTRVAVSLAGTLQLFNIPKEKVAPVGLSDALGNFQLAWVTDAVTKENVQLVMEQGGINGNVTFAPPGAEQSGQLVDVQIKLADPGSFERSRWKRGEPWRNPAPYPLRLKYVHALLIGTDNRPAVYSWRLGDALLAPGGRAEWDASLIPEWVDRKALRMWVNYALVEDCDACRQQVMKSITAGVTSVASSQITFHTINPLASMGAYELAVRVRSTRFDPEGRETKEKSVVLKADDQDFTVGPIYVGEESGRGSDVLFEYFITVAMADGTEHEAQRWIPSSDLRVLIGRSQIEKALGFVPGGPASGATPTSDARP
jgi:hypothetical protein